MLLLNYSLVHDIIQRFESCPFWAERKEKEWKNARWSTIEEDLSFVLVGFQDYKDPVITMKPV